MEERSLFERCEDISNNWTYKMPMMAMAVCGELIQTISRFERGIESGETNNGNNGRFVWNATKIGDVVEEMADVFISCSALCHQYGITEEDVVQAIDQKLQKNYD